jgi:protein-S-isoprenylcysteine O-methyltransferase Ste14
MSENNAKNHIDEKTGITPGIVRRFIQLMIIIILQAVILFFAAGRLDYGEGWAYLVQYVGFIVLNAILLMSGNKDLIEERSRILENTKGWDRVVSVFYGLFGLGMLLVAALDARWGWSPHLGLAPQIIAWVIMALGYGMFSWAMASNKYFSVMVRIQEERGHAVAIGGPYRFLRHPGYIGIIVYSLALPVMFSSLWTFLPAMGMVVVIIIRTILEDRTLHRELAGYTGYAQKVRYRLIPGVW